MTSPHVDSSNSTNPATPEIIEDFLIKNKSSKKPSICVSKICMSTRIIKHFLTYTNEEQTRFKLQDCNYGRPK